MAYPPASPAPNQPPAQAPEPPPLQLSADDCAAWWGRITMARAARKQKSGVWANLLASYLPPVDGARDTINSNVHFRNAHLKIAELWAQMPEWHLTPLEPLEHLVNPQTQQPFMKPDGTTPMDPSEIAAHVVSIKRAVLNYFLGPDHADADHAILEALFNILATAGIGPCKVHYQCDLQPTMVDVPGPPTAMPGAVLGIQQVPGPSTQELRDVPVYERFCLDSFSPEKLLMPHDWRSTQYDRAPWLGEDFIGTWTDIKRLYKLSDAFRPNASRDDRVLAADRDSMATGQMDLVTGARIWLRASHFDPAVAHSELFYFLVLIDGVNDQPAQYRRSPYQTIGPDGRLTADSMIGNPIHPIVLRVLPDHAYVPADAAFTDPLVRIENTWMSQDIKARDANIPRFFYDETIKESVDKLETADVGQGAGVPAEKLAQGIEKLIAPIPHLEHAQSDTAGRAGIQHAIQETLGIGSNQAGNFTNKIHSATESAIVQASVSKRLKSEQTQLMKSVLALVRKFDSLVQRYGDARGFVEVVGAEGERTLAMWDQHLIAGRYAYAASPDSQLTSDPEKRIKRVLDYVNFLAKSPYTNQAEMHRIVDLEFGYDPSRMMKTPDPPPEPKPAVSYSFKGEDLIDPLAVSIMLEAGMKITPQMITSAQQLIVTAMGAVVQMPVPGQAEALVARQEKKAAANQPHGGPADKSDVLSKHTSEQTGQLTGPKPGGALPQAPTTGMVQ